MKKQVIHVSKEVSELIDIAINKAVEKAFYAGQSKVQDEVKNYFQHLENRLAAHSQLILNIEKYDKDIEDIKTESKIPGNSKSKDIVFIPNGGIKLDSDEILDAKILAIKRKKQIDQEEIDEIKDALQIIENDEYFKIIEYRYFEAKTDDEIAELIPCDSTTVWRNRSRLLRQMMIKLYGANALKMYAKTTYKKPKKYVQN